eukprot:GEMP01020803.1.p1 GENE.GEMP01020803.1~~GEMP01020803.1.p1  ORF type:complete len:469 (+),score=90.77 GEMP01020803.1:375-1781(+)
MVRSVVNTKKNKCVLEMSIAELCSFVRDKPVGAVLKGIDKLREAEQRWRHLHPGRAPANALRQVQDTQNIAFFAAARQRDSGGSHRILKKLQDIGLQLNMIDYFKQTPLFYAAREYNCESIKLLVQAGCRVEQVDSNNQTCLYYGVREPTCGGIPRAKRPANIKRRKETAELLISLECPTETRDCCKKRVFEYADDSPELQRIVRQGNANRKGVKRSLPRGADREWLLAFDASRDGPGSSKLEYGIRYAEAEDVAQLGELEDEFISDHQDILEKLFGERPPNHAACLSLGLNVHPKGRRNTISSIASKTDKIARTLTAVERDTGVVAGYLYFKCKSTKDGRNVEISHLKVRNSHRRRGIGRELIRGVTQHLLQNGLEDHTRDMRLSVFDTNAPAISMYESIGFKQTGASWHTTMKEWQGIKEDGVPKYREICWRRYIRATAVGGSMMRARATYDSDSERGSRLRRRLL